MHTFAIVGDAQAPYHDERAVSVAEQIIHDLKPDKLVLNGDWADFRCLSRYPLTHDEEDDRLVDSLHGELEKARTRLHQFVKRCRAKKVVWHDGNHEWRIQRAFEKDDRALRIIGLKTIKENLSSAALFRLADIGVGYVGAYPLGSWLHPSLGENENVWVEHGYMARVKAGFLAQNLLEKRGASVIVGHCEKAALVWRRFLRRRCFAIESGNLSLIGEPDRGAGIYGGVPHSVPEYMDHQQGFTVVTYDANQFWPELVAIHHGKACFRGKLYRA